jgi:hypothetical protein
MPAFDGFERHQNGPCHTATAPVASTPLNTNRALTPGFHGLAKPNSQATMTV